MICCHCATYCLFKNWNIVDLLLTTLQSIMLQPVFDYGAAEFITTLLTMSQECSFKKYWLW